MHCHLRSPILSVDSSQLQLRFHVANFAAAKPIALEGESGAAFVQPTLTEVAQLPIDIICVDLLSAGLHGALFALLLAPPAAKRGFPILQLVELIAATFVEATDAGTAKYLRVVALIVPRRR